MDPVAKTLVVIGGLLIVGAVGEFVFGRTRVPDLVWLVGAGILLVRFLTSFHQSFFSRVSLFSERLR
jgi:hypothetical protein